MNCAELKNKSRSSGEGEYINRVFKSDCFKLMQEMPPDFIDCTITSPPYNKGDTGAVLVPKIKYDCYEDNIPEEQYQQNQIDILNQLYRVTKLGGSCFYNHKSRWSKGKPIHPFSWIGKSKWQMRQMIVWNRKLTGNLRAWRFYQTHEELWWLWKDNGESPGKNQINMAQASFGTVWNIPPYQNKEIKHPCLFPPEIPARFMLATTNVDDIIFDPFAGCGTTLVVANQLGRRYIGVDISQEYVKICNDRILKPFPGDVQRINCEKYRQKLELSFFTDEYISK